MLILFIDLTYCICQVAKYKNPHITIDDFGLVQKYSSDGSVKLIKSVIDKVLS